MESAWNKALDGLLSFLFGSGGVLELSHDVSFIGLQLTILKLFG